MQVELDNLSETSTIILQGLNVFGWDSSLLYFTVAEFDRGLERLSPNETTEYS